MKKYIIIKADTNDADYTEKCSIIKSVEGWITKEEIEQLVTKLADALKQTNNHHNWPNFESSDKDPYDLYVPEFLTNEEVETINELCMIPYDIHSIKSIKILTVVEEIKLL